MPMTRKEAADLIAAIDSRDFIAQKLAAVTKYLSSLDSRYRCRVTTVIGDIPVEYYVAGSEIIKYLNKELQSANTKVIEKGGM